MMSNESLLHNASLLAAARIGALGAQPLSAEMLSQCVLEAYQMSQLSQKLMIGLGTAGALEERLAQVEPKVSSEALAARLGQALQEPMNPGPPPPRF